MSADLDTDFSNAAEWRKTGGQKAGMQARMGCRKGKYARKEHGRYVCSITQVSSHCLLCTDLTRDNSTRGCTDTLLHQRHITAVNGIRH